MFRIPSYIPEGLLLAAIVFGPLAFGAVEPWSRAILEIDLFLLLIACSLSAAPRPNHPLYTTLLPGFLILIALSVIQRLSPVSPASAAQLFPFTVSPRSTGRELLLWSSYAGLLWCAPQILASRDAIRRFLWTLSLIGAAIALVGVIQWSQGNSAYYGLRHVRHGEPFGPYVNRDHAASMLAMCALSAGGLLLSRWIDFLRLETIGEKADVIASQAVIFLSVGIISSGLLVAHSRGAANSLFAALWLTGFVATHFIADRRLRWAGRLVLILSVSIHLIALWLNPRWIGSIYSTPDRSTAHRLSMYRAGWQLFWDHPIWGVGLGAFRTAYPPYQEPMIVGLVDHVHGDWLEFAIETGICGAIIAVGGMLSYLAKVFGQLRTTQSRTGRCIAAGLFAAAAMFLLHEAVDFSFHVPANAVIFLSLVSCLGSVSGGDEAAGRRPSRWRPLIGLCGLALMCVSARPAAAWWLIHRAELAQERDQPSLWRRALEWDDDGNTHYFLAHRAFREARESPVGRIASYQSALAAANAAICREPYDARFLGLRRAILLDLSTPR